MKKKMVTICLVVALVLTAVAGGTLAYFTDNDKASNTFEMGGVDIELIERAYENGAWTEIESPDGFAELGQLDPGVVKFYNKGVFTINEKDAAYIRNYVAVETLAEKDVHKIWYNNEGVTDASEAPYRHGSAIEAKYENVNIGGTLYDIYVFDTINDEAVQEGNSFMTLTTVSLVADVTNEDVEALGDKFEVYTFSEAIQAAGLTHADAMTALIGADNTLEAHAIRVMTDMITN